MEWVHGLELGLFVGQWGIVAGAGKLNGKRDHFKSFLDVRERGTRARRMPADATPDRVALQGRFPAKAEVKEVMKKLPVSFIFLGLLFHESALAPAAPETVRTRTGIGE
jgi:hypothetical protein